MVFNVYIINDLSNKRSGLPLFLPRSEKTALSQFKKFIEAQFQSENELMCDYSFVHLGRYNDESCTFYLFEEKKEIAFGFTSKTEKAHDYKVFCVSRNIPFYEMKVLEDPDLFSCNLAEEGINPKGDAS